MSETVAVTGPNGLTFKFPADTARGLLRHSDISNSEVKASDTGVPLIPNLTTNEDAKRAASTNGFRPRSDGGTEAGAAETTDAVAGRVAKEDGAPKGNASRDEWHDYALANGHTAEDLDGLKQSEIRALFSTDS